MKPRHEVRQRKEPGAPYTRHTIYVDGTIVHEQLSPYSASEIAERVQGHLQPSTTPAVRDVSGKAGRPSKKQTVNAAGFLWKDEAA